MDIYDICDCIDTIEICDGYDNNETKLRILESLLRFLLKAYHTFHNIISDRPKPLLNKKSIHQKVKEGMAWEILSDYMNTILDEHDQKDTNGVMLVLDEEQQNYILGRRKKGEGVSRKYKKSRMGTYHAANFC